MWGISMIKKDIVDIQDGNLLKIQNKIIQKNFPFKIGRSILTELNKIINKKVNKVVIEHPYYDADYLSIYYCFYSKKHQHYPKDCVRVHFYYISSSSNIKNQYYGYITIRPTGESMTIGKSYLSPNLFLEDGDSVMTGRFKTHCFGEEFFVYAFPWMQQESDVVVCAHVAIWSVLRYFGQKYPNYHNVTMGDVVEKLPGSLGRKIPTASVSIQHIPDIFKTMGFSPKVISKAIIGENAFQREMMAYIESGIPLIGCMTEKNHAVSIIGYRSNSKEKIRHLVSTNFDNSVDKNERILYNNIVVNKIIINDDNHVPYRTIRKRSDFNPFDREETYSETERFVEDIDFLIVPLYDRMQYNYSSLHEAVKTYVDKVDFLDKEKKYIARAYITSGNSLKEHAVSNIECLSLREIIVGLSMPRFVWCVELSTIDEFETEKVSAKMVIDTTRCNHDLEPWILLHNQSFIKYYDDGCWKKVNCHIEPYNKFYNLGVVNHNE